MSSLLNLKIGMCRWPYGDPKDKDFHFCGKPSDYLASYCPDHTVTAHAPSRPFKAMKKIVQVYV